MDESHIVIEISHWTLIAVWLGIKLASAAYLQRCYVQMTRMREAITGEIELKRLARHFLLSFLFYPEATILWACVWPIFALITWRWHPRNLLPGTVLDYLEFRGKPLVELEL